MPNSHGFFSSLSRPVPRAPVLPEDERHAHRLRKIIVDKRKRKERWSLTKWANEFRLLRQGLDDQKRIEKVLDWYDKKVGQKYTPIVDSAKSFRAKFDKMEEMMEREQPTVVVGDVARRIADQLKRTWTWPKGSGGQLEEAVQLSLDKVKKFADALKICVGWKVPHQSANPEMRFAEHVWCIGTFNQPSLFVQSWFERVHKQIVNWDDWSGNLMAMAWDKDNKTFDAMGAGWSVQYCGTDKYWTKLKEVLK